MHFRRGEHEQWREEFSEADNKLVDELMQERLLGRLRGCGRL